VADISCRVGYSSVGTFTTRFTRSVGVSPNRYRHSPPSSVLAIAEGYHRLPNIPADFSGPAPSDRSGSLAGQLRPPAGTAVGKVLLGVFEGPIPQRHPVACRLLHGQNRPEWRIDNVPAGPWLVLALALQPAEERSGAPALLVANSGSVEVRPGATTVVSNALRPPRPADPPILLTVQHPLDAHDDDTAHASSVPVQSSTR
jgi:AraC family transcriptional regulator